MPPLLFFLFYMLIILLIPAKCVIGLVSSLKYKPGSDVPHVRSLQILGSISLFFSVYFLIMMSAGIKGSVIFGPTAILFYIVAVILFANSIANDVIIFLYMSDPTKQKITVRYSVGSVLINYVIYIGAYFLMASFLGKSLEKGLSV